MSYHGRQNWSKSAGNGTTSALTGINEVTDIAKKSPQSWSRRFSVAPMMEWTDRHCRFFHRLLTRRALLYTEMLTTGAVLHGDRARLLRFDRGRASVGAAARRLRSACACRLRAHRRRSRLRRDQSQCRLPVRPRAGRPLRRLPDGGAGACRRLRRGDEGCGRRSRLRSNAASASTTRIRNRRWKILRKRWSRPAPMR